MPHKGHQPHDYRNASAYIGKRVLVVGFGNSGDEIAHDLTVARIDTTLAVRGAVQILPAISSAFQF
jgi:cation diffusion facilitator CzcD-associated flavoprotein CzcO